MIIGFLGFGEAAYCITKGFYAQGVEEMIAYDAMQDDEIRGSIICEYAEENGVTLLDCAAAVAMQADIIFAAVPSGFTLELCRQVSPVLRSGQVYADVSASTPATKEKIWALLEERGVLFADAAMLGSLPQDLHRVPITVSGNGALEFARLMTPLGMRITQAGDKAGTASAIKLVRSIFMKGLAACMCETMQAADAYNVTEEVVTSLAASLDGIPFTKHLDRLVTGTAIHAARRAEEVKGSIQMLEECELDSSVAKAAVSKHELLARYCFVDRFARSKPKGWKEIIELMR